MSGPLLLINSPYRVTGNITVPATQILTIEAGVIIKFRPGFNMTVLGTLVSNGTVGQPVYLTSESDDTIGGDFDAVPSNGSPGQWGPLQFTNSTSATLLENTFIRFGTNVNLTAASPVLNGVAIENQSGVAVNADMTSFPSGSGNTAIGCTYNVISLGGGIVGTGTWGLRGIPYRLTGDSTINAGSVLTIAPGVVIKNHLSVGNGRIFANGGSLRMQGTPSLPIYLTSLRDDSVGGDSNTAGTGGVAGAPSINDHRGINLTGAGTSGSRFEHVVFRYAGAQGNSALILDSSTASVKASTFTSNGPTAIDMFNAGTTPTIEDSLFQNNTIAVSGSANNNGPFIVRNSTFIANGNGAVSAARPAEISGNVFDNNGRAVNIAGSGTTLFSNNIFRNNSTGSGSQMMMHINPTVFLTGGGNVGEPSNSFNAIYWQGGAVNTGLVQDVGFPYTINGDLTINAGTVLTVAPGIVFKNHLNFGNGRIFANGGSLRMQGTPSLPIYLTSLRDDSVGGDSNTAGTGGVAGAPSINDHRGINLTGAGTSGSRFEHVVFRYAGAQGNSALILDSSTASVKASTFTSNGPTAIDMFNAGTTPTIEDSLFQNNTIAVSGSANNNGPFIVRNSTFIANGNGAVSAARPAEISGNVFDNNGRAVNIAGSGTTLFSNNIFRNNSTGSGSQMMMHINPTVFLTGGGNVGEPSNSFNAIYWQGGAVNTGLVQDVGFPYTINGDLTINAGTVLTVAPGVTIKNHGSFGNGRIFANGGTLLMQGTSTQPITYTSLRDDSVGGDSNIGGTSGLSGSPAVNDHRGVLLSGTGSSASRFDYAFFRYGGFQGHAVLNLSNSSAAIRNSEFRQNGQQGVLATAGASATPLIINTSFASNTVGLDSDSGAMPEVHASNFQGNSIGLRNNSAGQVNAENNYWNSASGPTHAGNPGGTGDSVQGNVDYVPFIGSPSSGVEPTVTGVTLLSANPLRPGTTAAVRVTFNKDMNAAVAPTLTYGRSTPYADFSIGGGSWVSGTAYEATATIDLAAAEGLHRLRVSGAQDIAGTTINPADFDYYTVDATAPGAPSLTAAVPQPAGAIALTWQAPAGEPTTLYRVYRATEDFTSVLTSTLVRTQAGTTYTDTPAEDGLYYYAVTAADVAGNEGAFSNRRSTLSMHAAPSAPQNLAAAAFRAERFIELSWNAPAIGTATAYDLYRATYATTGLPGMTVLQAAVTALYTVDRPVVDGFYRYRATARDLAGNVSVASDEASAFYDVNPPTITVTGVTNGQHYRADRSPDIEIVDFSAFGATITLNGQDFASGSTVSAPGAYLLVVTAEDTLNAISSKTISFVIDKSSPAIDILFPLPGSVTNQNVTVVFASADDFSPTGSLTIRDQGNAAPPYSYTSDGLRTVTLTATDLAGNASSSSVTFTLDKTAPTSVTNLRLTAVREGEIDLSWTAPSDALSGTARYILKTATYPLTAGNFNGAAAVSQTLVPQAAGSDETLTVLANTALSNFFMIKTSDTAGNLSAASNLAFLDLAGPAVSPFPASAATLGRPTTIDAQASDISGVDRVVFSVDGISVSTRSVAPFSFLLNTVSFTDGEHVVGFEAYDEVGNVSTSTYLYTLFYVPPPAPSITSPANGFNTTAATITVTGSAEAGTTVQIRVDGTPYASGLASLAGSYSVQVVLVSEGSRVLTARALDARGVSGPSGSVTVNYDLAAPNPPANFAAAALPAGKVRLTWTVPGGKVPSAYRLYRAASALSLSSGVVPSASFRVASGLTGTAVDNTPSTDGVYYFGATSMDTSGNESGLSSVASALSDRVAPTAAVTHTTTPPLGVGSVPVTLTLSEVLASAPLLTFAPSGQSPFALDLSPSSPTVWTGTLTVTGAMNPGAAVFAFQGADFTGNVGGAVTAGTPVTIDNRGPVATITVLPVSPVPAGTFDLALVLDEPAVSTPSLAFVTAAGSTIPVSLAGAGTTWIAEGIATPVNQDGTAFFRYASTDNRANVGTSIALGASFILDTTPPGAPLALFANSKPAGVVDLSWSAPIGEAAHRYRVYRDNVALPALVVPLGDGSGRLLDSPSEGVHTYEVSALDVAGNEGARSPQSLGNADATPPAVPDGSTATINTFNRIELSWRPGDAEVPATYRVYRTTYATVSSSGLTAIVVSTPPLTDLPPQNGTIYYRVGAVDAAGNVSTGTNATSVFFDRAPPVITFAGVTENGLYNHAVTPTFSIVDPALIPESVVAKLNGAPFNSGTQVTAEAAYTLTVTATNTSAASSTETVHFIIDLTSPSVSVTGVVSGQTYNAAVIPVVNAADPRLQSVTVTLDAQPYTPGVPVETDGSHTLTVDALDTASNRTILNTTFTLNLPPPAPTGFNMVAEEGTGALLAWTKPAADVVGYRAFRNNAPLHQGLLSTTTPRFTDSSFAQGQAAVFAVAAVDSAGQEGVRATMTIPQLSFNLASYGVTENDQPALIRGFFDAVALRATNASGVSRLAGPANLELLANGSPTTSATAPSVSVPAGGEALLTGAVAVPVNLPEPSQLRATLRLPTEPGTIAFLRRVFTVHVRDPREPIVEVFPEALVRGTNKAVRVKFNNRGSAAAEIRTGVLSDVLVELKTAEGTLLSSARLDQRANGAQAAPSAFFVSVPGNASFLFDPVSIFVPNALGTNGVIRAAVEKAFTGLLTGGTQGPRAFERSVAVSGVAEPPYRASVSPEFALYDQNVPVRLVGEARDTATMALVPGATVQVGVAVRGFERLASTRTDGLGQFVITFAPTPSEAGLYAVYASHPDVVDKTPQSTFTIAGLALQFAEFNATVTQNSGVNIRVNLTNTGETPVTGLSGAVISSAVLSGASLSLDPASLPSTLGTGQAASLSLNAAATAGATLGRSIFVLRVTESHGFTRDLRVNVDVSASAPVPVVDPQAFNIGMRAGESRTLQIALRNTGTRAWEGVNLSAPALAWARVNGPTTLGDIAPGGVQNIQLVLEPPSSLTSQAYASNPLLEVRSSNASAVPVNTLITLTASGQGNVVYSVINADKPRVLGQGEPIPTAEGQLVSLDIAGLSFRATADANGVVRLLNVPAGRYSYTVKANGFEESKGVQTIEPGITLTKEVLLLTQVVTYEWTVVPTTIEDQYNITLGITFKTDVPAPVVVMEPAVFNFNLEGGQSVDAQITVTNKGFVAADNVVVRPNITDDAIQIDMPYSTIPRLAAGQSIVVPFRLTLVHASCHQASVGGDYGYTCAAGTPVNKTVPPVQISAGTCFGIPTTSVGGPASTSNPFTNTSGGTGSGGISLSVPGSYVSFAVPNPPAPPVSPNTCKAPKEKAPPQCSRGNGGGSCYSDTGGDPRVPESDLSISVPNFGGSLDFTRVYDSQDYAPTSMGIAWRHSFESRVELLRAVSTFFKKRGDTAMSVAYGGGAGGASLAAITTEVDANPIPANASVDTIVELRTPSGRRLVYRHTGGTSFSAPKGETGVLQVQGTTTTPTGFTWTLADQTVYTYDAAGKLLTIKDRNNNTVTLVYDGSNKLMTVRDPNNRDLYSLSYDGSGRLGQVTDLASRGLTFTYNGSGFLSQVVGPKGTSQYGYQTGLIEDVGTNGFANGIFAPYSAVHLLNSVTSPNGHVTSFSYGPPDKVIDYDSPDAGTFYSSGGGGGGSSVAVGDAGSGGRVARNGNLKLSHNKSYYTPLTSGGSIDGAKFAAWYFPQKFYTQSEVGPNGSIYFDHTVDELVEEGKTYVHLPRCGTYSPTAPLGGERPICELHTWEVTAGRSLASVVTDVDSRFTKTEFDVDGNRSRITDRAGRTAQIVYDSRHNPTRVTDPLGLNTNVTYDAVFNAVTSVIDARGNSTNFTYDGDGNMTQARDALNNAVNITYNAQGLATSITDPNNKSLLIGRNTFGLATSITDPLSRTAILDYDSLGRLTSIQDAAGKIKTYQYDTDDNLTLSVDALNSQTQLFYDPSPIGGPKLLKEIKDARNNSTTFGYDGRGRLITVNSIGLGLTRSYQYNDSNQVTQVTKPDGTVITFEYNPMGRLTRKNVPGDPIIYEYDVVGNLTKAEDADSVLQIAYDALNRPVTVIQTNKPASLTSRLDYEYDAVGNRTKMALASSPSNLVWGYAYNSRDLLTSVTDPQGRTASFEYDAFGRRTRLFYSNGTETGYAFDDASQITAVTHKRTLDNTVLSSAAYAYDDAGNMTSVVDESGLHAYTYDDLHRLTAASHPLGAQSPQQAETFSYDSVGNRSADSSGSGFVHDFSNRLAEDARYTYQYDANGNRTRRTSKVDASQTIYEWDKLDQLKRVIMPDGLVADYRHDVRGRVVETVITTTTTRTERRIYSGPDIVATLDQSGEVTRLITHGRAFNEPLMLARGAAVYFYHADAAGSVRALSDAAGQVVERVEYQAYGQPTFVAVAGSTYAVSQVGNPYAYTAAEWVHDTGLSNHQLRLLDLGTGEFVSREPFGLDGVNGYWYARANPNKFTDPNGTSAVAIALGAGAAITAPAWLPYAIVGGLVVVGAGVAYIWWQDNKPYEPIMAQEEKKQPDTANPPAPVPQSCPAPPLPNPNSDPNEDPNSNPSNPKRNNKDQEAVIDLAKEAKKKGGLNKQDADILQKWAKEYGVRTRGPEQHLNRNFNKPHIHVGPVDHIPVQ